MIRQGDIWLVPLDPALGHEQQGTRPVLVVSATPFNALTGLPVVLPITRGGQFSITAGFSVSLQNAGTRTRGIVRCDQPRTLDISARGGRRLESLPSALVAETLSRLQTLFEAVS